MTRDEALQRCAELKQTHQDRATHQWVPRESAGGEWEVVKVALPSSSVTEMTPEQRADEKPATGEDPRTSMERNIGGPYIGG